MSESPTRLGSVGAPWHLSARCVRYSTSGIGSTSLALHHVDGKILSLAPRATPRRQLWTGLPRPAPRSGTLSGDDRRGSCACRWRCRRAGDRNRRPPLRLGDARRDAAAAAEVAADLRGSPPALAGLHAQADELLDGGSAAFERAAALGARLAGRGQQVGLLVRALPGRSSRCFQRVSAQLGRRVAFIGVDSSDSSARTRRSSCARIPVSFPSYFDPHGRLGAALSLSTVFPVTIFYDAAGRRRSSTRAASTRSAQLVTDIRRYALAS